MNAALTFDALQRQMAQRLSAGASATSATPATSATLGTPKLDARLLLEHASGLSPEDLALKAMHTAPQNIQDEAMNLVAARLTGKPVAKIIGVKEFWGRPFAVSPKVLDPRPDSETLIEAALARLPPQTPLRAIDLGTGSGCLLLTLAAERPKLTGLGIDKSPAALTLARRNAHKLQLRHQVALRHGDWLHGVVENVDMIIANPPYIARAEIAELAKDVRLFDPRAALDGGIDGMAPYRLLIAPAWQHLKKGGYVLLEIGPTQAEAICAMLADVGFSEPLVLQDLAGRDRVLVAQKSQ